MSPARISHLAALSLLLTAQAVSAADPPADAFSDPLPAHALARLGTTRFRHDGRVISVAYSPDGKLLASGGWDNVVRIWDADTGKPFGVCRGHTDAVWPVVFSPDGKLLASAGRDGTIRLWDSAAAKEVRTLPGHGGGVYKILFTSDGKTLVSGSADKTVRIWDVESGKEQRQLAPGNEVHGLALSPDDKLLALGSNLGDVTLWDFAAGTQVRRFQAHKDNTGVDSVAFSPDGRLLASGGWDSTAALWEMPSGKLLHRLEGHADNVWPTAFAPDGKTLATAGRDATIRLWDVAKGVQIRVLEGCRAGVPSVRFSPDGKRLASASWDGAVRLWDPATGKEVGPVGGHAGAVTAVAFLPDGKHLTSAGADGTVRSWDARSGKETLFSQTELKRPQFALSGDGRVALAVGESGGLSIRDEAGKERCAFPGLAGVTGACLSRDGGLAAVANTDSAIHVYETTKGREVASMTIHPTPGAPPTLPLFSLDASTVVAAHEDHYILFWDAASGKQTAEIDAGATVAGLALSPDGKAVAAGTADGKVVVWELLTAKELRRFEERQGPVRALAFSPDGRLLASGGDDRSVNFRDLATGKSLGACAGHGASVLAVAFAADGKAAASGSADSTALVWNLDRLEAPKALPAERTAAEMGALWETLKAEDAAKADEAVWQMVAASKSALPYLRERLKAAGADARGLAKLLADLDDDDFDVRERATQDLTALGRAAAPALRAALDKGPSPEAATRIARVLASLIRTALPPEQIRALRSVEVLERVNTPEARELLEALAKGASDSPLTRDAKASLARLAVHPAP